MRKKLGDGLRLRYGVGACSLALMASSGAQAFTFDLGEVKGNFDTTVSLGATVSVEDPDAALVGIANGGTSRSVNEDDGKLNYKSGDVISALVKATHDLDIQYGSGGVFGRASYFYDAQADNDRENFGARGDDRLVVQGDLLDLFAYVNFKIDGKNASVRAGRQVVNWGESTFIGNSINSVNAIDVARLRAPGSELKEALLPHPMFWGTVSLTDSVSIESLWIWGFDEIELDPRGSFFSTNDFITDDGDTAWTGSGRRNDDTADSSGTATNAVGLRRSATRHPERKAGQYGFALRYFADWLNSTEIGLYYLKYHSRGPNISGIRVNPTAPDPQVDAQHPFPGVRYRVEYPEDIELYGISFNTDGPLGIALQGEYSYRPNFPLQLASTELLLAALLRPNVIDSAEGRNVADPLVAASLFGTTAEGFRRTPVHQAQMTGTRAFGPTLGANQFVLLGEAGVTFLDYDQDLLFNAPSVHLPSCRNGGAIAAGVGNGSCQENVGGGYADRTSWGYRAVARMDFENAIGPAQVSPRLVLAHDVNGTGPVFNQETKAVTVGIGFNYLQRWQADISFTSFFDGRNYSGTDSIPGGTQLNATTFAPGDASQPREFNSSANPNEDRDFVAVSVSYAF
jgi:hypothetical protein